MPGLKSQQTKRKLYPTAQTFKLLGYDPPGSVTGAVVSGFLRVVKEGEDKSWPIFGLRI